MNIFENEMIIDKLVIFIMLSETNERNRKFMKIEFFKPFLYPANKRILVFYNMNNYLKCSYIEDTLCSYQEKLKNFIWIFKTNKFYFLLKLILDVPWDIL